MVNDSRGLVWWKCLCVVIAIVFFVVLRNMLGNVGTAMVGRLSTKKRAGWEKVRRITVLRNFCFNN